MTIFAKRGGLNVTDWKPIQEKVGELQTRLGAPHDLMMFSIDTGSVTVQDIYIGLPDIGLLPAFPGFEEIKREDLPEYMSTLVVREDGFRQRFPDIAAKRNAASKRG